MRKRRLLFLLIFSLVTIAIALFVVFGDHGGRNTMQASGTCGTWDSLVPDLGLLVRNARLDDVAVSDPDDVWAVGSQQMQVVDSLATLIMHWDGTAWKVVESPNIGNGTNYLRGVTAIDADNAWAVGTYFEQVDEHEYWFRSLMLRWDGSTWQTVPLPLDNVEENSLSAVMAISRDDVWAVGYYEPLDRGPHPLALHWDGISWTMASPVYRAGDVSYLDDVDASSADNVFVVGDLRDWPGGITQAQRWDGSAWQTFDTPNPGDYQGYYGVATLAADDAWAVGGYRSEQDVSGPLLAHWNGESWDEASFPKIGSTEVSLSAIEAIAPDDIWTVGSGSDGAEDVAGDTVIIHWNGLQWSAASATDANAQRAGRLYGVAASPDAIWAVGEAGEMPLVMRSQLCP